MKVLIFDTAEQAITRVAAQIVGMVRAKPDAVLGLATGGTMPPVYARLVAACAAGEVSFSQARSFDLDEYVGLPADHPCSYHTFMQDHLFADTDFDPAHIFLPNGDAPDPIVESDAYEALIHATGPMDLQLLGIGANGHIGFNEPTSSLGSATRIKTLTKATRDANQRFFPNGGVPPRYAITVGIQTILNSRDIVLLATGATKSAAVAAMIEGPVGAFCPASALQTHRSVTVVLDAAAASDLKLREYYFTVHPNGKEEPIV